MALSNFKNLAFKPLSPIYYLKGWGIFRVECNSMFVLPYFNQQQVNMT